MSARTEQLHGKVPSGTAEQARRAAAAQGVTLGTYLARLVEEDTSSARAQFHTMAHGVLEEYGPLCDELKAADQAEGGSTAT